MQKERKPKLQITGEIEARYWAKVVRHETGCWPWIGALHRAGYGLMVVRENGSKRQVRATHIAVWLSGRDIPADRQVNHRCDNPGCVRPDHLYVGTCRQNAHDASKRGRFRDRRGEANANARLTDGQVCELRQRYDAGEGPSVLATIYRIAPAYVNQLVTGDARRTAGGPIQAKRKHGYRRQPCRSDEMCNKGLRLAERAEAEAGA